MKIVDRAEVWTSLKNCCHVGEGSYKRGFCIVPNFEGMGTEENLCAINFLYVDVNNQVYGGWFKQVHNRTSRMDMGGKWDGF